MTGGKIIDPKTFWRTLGQRAIGSTIVTARSSEGPAGFLGLSATHITADPPLMLVSIDKRTAALAAVLASRHFAVNFLPRDRAGGIVWRKRRAQRRSALCRGRLD